MPTSHFALFALTVIAAGCSDEPSASKYEVDWSNETDWSGAATMKTGTVVSVGFHATLATQFVSVGLAGVLKNVSTGATAQGFGSATTDGGSVSFTSFPENGFDGIEPRCLPLPPLPGQIFQPAYSVAARLTQEGDIVGTMKLSCNGETLDAQPIRIRRIDSK